MGDDLKATATTASYPAPVGGLNARDSLAAMKPSDAVILENWYPNTTSVDIRKGYQNWVTGFANPVQTLMKYAPTTGAYKIFAASGTSFYDASITGSVGAAVVTGLTNAQWQYTNITTPGGSYLWCVNGQDNGKIYDGSTWADVSISGVASNLIANVCVFGNRLYLIEKNKLKVWYLAVQSIAGAATAFDLSTIFPRGGYLMAMGSWSLDAGDGLDDHAVLVSSEGEVAVYSGYDPATWTKVGLFYIGRPLGRACLEKLGGDVLLLADQGIYPLSKALMSATVDRTVAVTDKIQKEISSLVTQYRNNFGWQMRVYPDQNQLWLNVPTAPSTSTSVQYVMNTITGAWCKFTNMNANCWEVVGPSIYFGGQSTVCKAWNGQFDLTGQIQADALTAYSSFKRGAQLKYITLVQPSIVADGNPSILFGLNTDFLNRPISGSLSLNPLPSSMVWGSMVWGSMVWGGSLQQLSTWQTVGAVAKYAAIRLTIQANGSQVSWNETSYLYQLGGVL